MAILDPFTTAIPTARPDGSLTATPRTGPEGTCGRVLPCPIGFGSVVESWNWKMPLAGTLVSNTFSSKTLAEVTGVGVGVAVGVGVGVGVAPPVEEPEPPPHDHEPAMVIASRTIHNLPKRIDRCFSTLYIQNSPCRTLLRRSQDAALTETHY